MSTSHIVELPFFVTIIRIAQLVLTIIILGLAGNTINGLTGGTGVTFGLEPLGFTIFCVCFAYTTTPLRCYTM